MKVKEIDPGGGGAHPAPSSWIRQFQYRNIETHHFQVPVPVPVYSFTQVQMLPVTGTGGCREIIC